MKLPSWIKLIKRVPVYRIKVIYLSGAVHEFEVYEFTWTGSGYTWKPADQLNKPIELGGPQIAAVWQVGMRFQWTLGVSVD